MVHSKVMKLIPLTLFVSLSLQAYGWGERGHHLIGKNAALLVADLAGASKEAKNKGVGSFFKDRALQMGHLANIPDTSWKESTHQDKKVLSTNGPTHYVDLEIFNGAPDKDMDSYIKKVRSLSPEFSEILKKYQGQDNPLPGTPAKYKKINVYKDAGTNPWRVRDLYEAMVKAFRCAKSKEDKSDLRKERKKWSLPLLSKHNKRAFYECSKKQSRLEALSAAIAIGGVLGHFIGDLAQPYHVTINFDGWEGGNGGVHEYMESDVVKNLGPELETDVLNKSKEAPFRKALEEDLKVDWKAKAASASFAIHLAANSYRLLGEALRLDDKYAIVKKGTDVTTGDKSFLFEKEKFKPAVRKPAETREVLAGHKPFLINRLAVGSYALAKIWYQAWEEGGNPNFRMPMAFPFLTL